MTRLNREGSAIGNARDVFGAAWLVRERRDSGHGWLIEIGWPVVGDGPQGVQIICTLPLAEYLRNTRLKDVDLPIGKTAVKRLRKTLELYWSWDEWWAERLDDLHTMKLEAFAKKHGCSVGAASQRRAKINYDGKKCINVHENA
ncbi:hypothetical protein NDQ72_01575 [Halomonas sp. KG2]|uniref:hypothetical protein n=1 Tax=Halomonas sp. KG2 TaxID=2951138 RepID=UPI00264885AE|nr:hypothetical protein [Halomonas sp. KG2]WKD28665.1 hypothetical protein NDQ72_01575 [Halomonas sp. KG2]